MARLIQFIHPGGEHIPDARSLQGKQLPYHFPWNTGDHKRKFLQGKGTYLIGKPGNWQVQKDKVFSFWCEAEWDTEYTPIAKNPQISANGSPLPQFLHSFVDKSLEMPVNRAQNTDPYIFGEYFRYVLCRQEHNAVLRNLKPNDIILFGSRKQLLLKNGKKVNQFLLDTVFVIGKTLCTLQQGINPPQSLVRQYQEISPDYYRRTLANIYQNNSTNNPCNGNASLGNGNSGKTAKGISNSANTVHAQHKITLSLYLGKMYPQQPQEIFSFVPVMPGSQCYPRPVLNSLKVTGTDGSIVEAIKTGAMSTVTTEIANPQKVWHDLVDLLLASGYVPAMHFAEQKS